MKKKALFATLVLSLLVIVAYSVFVLATGPDVSEDTAKKTTLNGTTTSDQFGISVATGDINNDSYADVIVGAQLADPSDVSGAGQAYVFFGSADGISDMDITNANLTFNGTTANDKFGWSVGSGDVNNDSYADIIVGATGVSGSAGGAYVFFGADYPSTAGISYDALMDANITINGTVASDNFGQSIASGDVNNDSYADVIVGANLADPSSALQAGQAYVFFGADYPDAVTISYNATEDANLTLNGTTANDNLGWSVGSGDVNNDSYADIIIGAYLADPLTGSDNAGQAYVFFGADYPNAVTISYNATEDANLTLNGTVASDSFGRSVGSGDINNDSYSDIIVGAHGADPSDVSGAGQAYVFFGADYPNAVTISYNALIDANITLNGTVASDYLGHSVASGDVNNDSYADIIVGAYAAPNPGDSTGGPGQTYVFFGADYTTSISDVATYGNITLNGTTAGDRLGYSVVTGDVNNDSYADIIVGAYQAPCSVGDDCDTKGPGQVYIYEYDGVAPRINLDAPVEFANFSTAMDFNYTSTDANLDTCELWGNWTGSWHLNETFISPTSGSANGSSVITIEDGLYVWNVWCNDSFGNSGFNETNFTLTVDLTNPSIRLDGPANGGSDSDGEINFTFTAIEAHPDVCSLYVNSTVSDWDWNASTSYSNDTQASIAVNLSDATYTWNVECNDTFGNSAFNETNYTITVSNDASSVALNSPADNSYDTDGLDIVFNFTATETYPEKCTLFFRSNATNWEQNETIDYSSNTQHNFSSLNLTDAVYIWNVECNDTLNNPAFASANRTVTVDTTSPVIPIVTEPSDTSINPRDSISYACQSTDATAGISKWTWTLTKPQNGGTVTKTGSEVTSNSQTFSGDDDNLAGSYTVVCEVEDKAGFKSSSSSSFSVYYSHAPEGAGPGAGPSAAAQLDFTIQEEVKIKEPQGAIMTFTLDGTTVHTIKLRKVTTRTVTIIIESEPIEVTLEIGETKQVDIDVDGVNDISVTLNDIVDGLVDLTTKRLTPLPEKEVPTEEVPPEEAPEEVTPTAESPSKAWIWILIIVVVVVIGIGYYFMKKKK